MGIAKMQADGSRVSTFVILLGYIQLDLIYLAMCISSSFLSLLSSGQPGRTELYSLHFGKPRSLVATLPRQTQTQIHRQ
jgi:hypothetical protein